MLAQLLSRSPSFFTSVLISKQSGCRSQSDEAFAGVWQHKKRYGQWSNLVTKLMSFNGKAITLRERPLRFLSMLKAYVKQLRFVLLLVPTRHNKKLATIYLAAPKFCLAT